MKRLAYIAIFFFAAACLPVGASATTLRAGPNNSGLIGYWSFNEGTTTSAGDFSGNRNTGTLTNMATPATAASGWGNGRFGKGLNFDGINDYVDMGDVADMGTSDMTLSAWFKTTDTNAAIVVKSRLGSLSGRYYLLINAGNLEALMEGFGQYTASTPASPYLDNKWHHAVVTYSRTGNMILYVDAVQKSSVNISVNSGTNMDTNCNLLIGIYNGSTCTSANGGFEMNGSIDDVRIYNRALSSSEVTSLFKAGIVTARQGPSRTGLLLHLPFDEATSTIASDLSVNSRKGTLTNMAFPPTSSSGWALGKFGNSVRLDGSNDYVSVPDSNDFAFGTGDFTMSAWVNFAALSQSSTGPSIMSQNEGGGTTPKWIFLYPGATSGAPAGNQNKISFHMNNTGQGTGSWVSGNAWTPTLGQWYHVAVVRSGNNFTFYRDGAFDRTDTSTFSIPNVNSDVRIGQSENTFYFNGRIDEPRIYNRALSAAEIASLYAAKATTMNASRSTVLTDGLLALYSFDGADTNWGTNKVYDGSTLRSSASILNMSTTTTPVPGRIGQAFRFDGSNDYVSLGTDTFTTAQVAAGTFSAWFKMDQYPANNTVMSLFDIEGYLGGQLYGSGGAAFARARMVSSVTGSTQLSTGRWYHYVQTWDGTTVTAYLDGVFETSLSAGSPSPSSLTRLSTIGASYVPDSYFAGSIDDVRLYGRVLSADEIKVLYNLGR